MTAAPRSGGSGHLATWQEAPQADGFDPASHGAGRLPAGARIQASARRLPAAVAGRRRSAGPALRAGAAPGLAVPAGSLAQHLVEVRDRPLFPAAAMTITSFRPAPPYVIITSMGHQKI